MARRFTRRLRAAAVVFGVWVLVAWVAGRFLVVNTPLHSADAIVVMSGSAVYKERTQRAAEYYRLAPGRIMATLAGALSSLAVRGQLRVDDPSRAAEQLAFLILGPALDRAMFEGPPSRRALTRAADDGVRAFLAAYGR